MAARVKGKGMEGSPGRQASKHHRMRNVILRAVSSGRPGEGDLCAVTARVAGRRVMACLAGGASVLY
jgi:hypothetical protein